MFFHHRRTSFYPFVIVLLTIGLAALMFVTLSGSTPRPLGESAAPAVTESDYRAQSREVIVPFLAAYQSAETDVAKLVATEDALIVLTALTVPASYKEVHLGLAVSLTLMRDGLRGEEGAEENGYAKLMALIGNYPWLAE